MKALASFFLLLVLFTCSPQRVSAFGPVGHKIIATIAMRYLTPAVQQNVQSILGETSPEDAATWMDDMRDDPAYNYMKPWHFINIEKGQSYKPDTNNIIWKLERVYAELQHPEKLSKKARKEDLMILFHLMGDLHQPLHVGYGVDKGGNLVQVTFKGFVTDLHHVWDSDIIRDQHITADACLKLSNIKTEDITNTHFTPAQFVEYMKDSRAGLPAVYSFTGGTIDQVYIIRNKPVVMIQLQHAGMRLAAVLQSLFGRKSTATPVTAASGIEMLPNAIKAVTGTITPEDAAKHIGEEVTVCGKVFGGKYSEYSKDAPTFINMGAAYPNSPLTVVIFGDDGSNFSYKPEVYLIGKTICVKGLVKEYKGKPEIIVSKEEQIQIR